MKPIMDQGSCGGCWGFAMLGMMEGFLNLQGASIPSLSVQQLLDCDRKIDPIYGLGNEGCDGGYFQVASDYLTDNSVAAGSSYPFSGISGATATCLSGMPLASPTIVSFDTGYISKNQLSNITIEKLEENMENRVRLGPVAVGLATVPAMFSYGSGIYDGDCGTAINHAVVIVGFTSDYWIVRNSWGADWGESGYIRIARVNGSDPCMMYSYWAQALQIGDWPVQLNDTSLTTPNPNSLGGIIRVNIPSTTATIPSSETCSGGDTTSTENSNCASPPQCCPNDCCETPCDGCQELDWDDDDEEENDWEFEDTTTSILTTIPTSTSTTTRTTTSTTQKTTMPTRPNNWILKSINAIFRRG